MWSNYQQMILFNLSKLNVKIEFRVCPILEQQACRWLHPRTSGQLVYNIIEHTISKVLVPCSEVLNLSGCLSRCVNKLSCPYNPSSGVQGSVRFSIISLFSSDDRICSHNSLRSGAPLSSDVAPSKTCN